MYTLIRSKFTMILICESIVDMRRSSQTDWYMKSTTRNHIKQGPVNVGGGIPSVASAVWNKVGYSVEVDQLLIG